MASVYDITQLADLTGLSVRTIRYYLQERLLPPSGSPGPGAKYDDEHVARLRLIGRLQRDHVPLSEIRRRLDPGIPQIGDAPPPEETPANPAMDYLRSLSAKALPADAVPAHAPPPDMGGPPRPPAPALRPGRLGTSWERVELAPGVELHVRRPLSRFEQRRIDRLLAEAHRIFSELP